MRLLHYEIILGLCFCAVSLLAIVLTVYDKWAAKHNPRRRIREATLLLVSFLGGSVAMYCTMLTIRHKTKHAKFMIGIPAIILLQIAAIFLFAAYIFKDFNAI